MNPYTRTHTVPAHVRARLIRRLMHVAVAMLRAYKAEANTQLREAYHTVYRAYLTAAKIAANELEAE